MSGKALQISKEHVAPSGKAQCNTNNNNAEKTRKWVTKETFQRQKKGIGMM
jgi:hypothetical protein